MATALTSRLWIALAVAVAGGLLLAIGPLLHVVTPPSPGYAAGPLLIVLGLLPAGVAVLLAVRGSSAAVGGVLTATALFAPGRALVDAQLAVNVNGSVARPEFATPTSLDPLHGSTGLWFLLAGHALTLAAGVIALSPGDTGDPASRTSERRPGSYQGPVLIALGLGALAAVALVALPFTSSSPFLLAKSALDTPTIELLGGVLIAIAVPLAGTIAVTSAESTVAKGWLFGAAACVLTVALPRLVAGLSVTGLHPTWGPYGAVVAAGGLVAFGLVTDRTVAAGMDTGDDTAEPADLNLPGQSRLHLTTGVFGLLAAGAALVGADTSLFVLPADFPHPPDVASRLLIPAAAVVGVAAIGMLVPRWAAAVRPAFAVAWIVVLVAGTGVFDTALTATQIDGVHLGPGFWSTGLAMLTALVAGCCAGLAGGVERDDVDLTSVSWQPTVLVPAAAAALLAFGAFGVPVLRADGYTQPGLWTDFRFASWGLVFGLIAVIAAALLAPACRPKRAAALLFGAAGVVLVRVLELPVNRTMLTNPSSGPGLVLGIVCLVALLAAAVVALWLHQRRSVGQLTRSR
ncbi:MAG TPA: hypothetical protein VHF06_12300 [Pseudonocardiaceae bacterium]|jgi:hypothetical protein|nr:hypothetical protein [Pseudonocardiaceae bacterium]